MHFVISWNCRANVNRRQDEILHRREYTKKRENVNLAMVHEYDESGKYKAISLGTPVTNQGGTASQ
jgi:hypothetical protein